MNTRKIIGINLKYLRYTANKSQEEFYHNLGLSYKYLASVERGEVNITVNFLDDLAKRLNINVSDLVTFDETKVIQDKRYDSKRVEIK